MFSDSKLGDLLRPVIVEDGEVFRLKTLDEASVAVGDNGGELHDVDVDRLRHLEALGVDGRCRSSTLDVLGRHADRMLDDSITGVPVAVKWLTAERADFAAVGEEHNLLDLS